VTTVACGSFIGTSPIETSVLRSDGWEVAPNSVLPDVPPWRNVYPFFSGQAWPWHTRVDGLTTLDPNSANICAYLQSKLTYPGLPSAAGPPVYVVGPSQTMVPVTISPDSYGSYIHNVPIPSGATASTGEDHYMVVVQETPSAANHRLWEMWTMVESGGAWTSGGGINRMHILTDNPGYSRLVKDSGGTILEEPYWGVAASRLSLLGGVVQIAELQTGVIEHALQLNVPWARQAQWSFPAQSCDGTDTATYSIPEGAWFRLDPTVDLTTLGLTSLMLVLTRAVQRYGMLVGDQTGAGVGIIFEDPGSQTAAIAADADGPTNAPEGGTPLYLQSFPWEYLQLLPMDLRTTQDNTLYIEADDTNT
jgi:hypothetical protein